MAIKTQLDLFLILPILFFNYFTWVQSMEFKDKEAMLLHELSGTTLRLSAFPYLDPDWFKIQEDPNGTITYSGSMKAVADSMAELLNITIIYVRVPEAEAKIMGPKEAAFNMLLRNEIDVLARYMIMNLDHCSRMDCSLNLLIEKNKLMVPWPDEESPVFASVRSFQSQVWIMLLISVISVSLMIAFLQKFNQSNDTHDGEQVTSVRNHGINYHAALIYVLNGKGDWSRWKKLSFRIMQGCWCLAAFVLVNAYSTTLVSNLVAPKLMPVCKSYEDLAAGYPQNLKMIAEKNENVDRTFKAATSGVFKILGDQFRKYPESLFVDRNEGFEKLFKGGYAYKGVTPRVESFMAKAFQRAGGQCRFTISNDSTDPHSASIWGFRKNWRYTDAVNSKLKWWPESGLIYFWSKNDNPRFDSCKLENRRKNKDNKDDRKVLSLSHLSGPFVFLIAGSTFSFFVFLIEVIYFKIKRRIAAL